MNGDTKTWGAMVRDVGFPAFAAAVLLWAFVFRVPAEIAALTTALRTQNELQASKLDRILDTQQQQLLALQRLLERKG